MAETLSPSGAPVPFKAVEEANKNLIEGHPPQKYWDLINTLPVRVFGPRQHRLYEGFWLPHSFMPGILTIQNDFQSRPTDLFLASYPKSGTTWLKALVFAIMTRKCYPLNQHPLLTNNPHQCVAFMEEVFTLGQSSLVEAIPSPRILSTHLPHSILPNSITDTDCQIIYVYRDPKDVSVSMYHFASELNKEGDHKAPFNDFFSMFCDGASVFGPIWDHVLGFWRKSVDRPEKILFLKYEDMLMEPKKHVKKMAEFINQAFSETEEEQGIIEQIIELCSFQKLKDLEVNKTMWRPLVSNNENVSRAAFFRKGVTGDWRNNMSLEMAQRFDSMVNERFKGSGLEIQAETRST
ncbi:hypothetical protein LUZ60_001803 [Juncus effusus]|nr:hypothetical protein LUZ60_001803 [Juncus effusus]